MSQDSTTTATAAVTDPPAPARVSGEPAWILAVPWARGVLGVQALLLASSAASLSNTDGAAPIVTGLTLVAAVISLAQGAVMRRWPHRTRTPALWLATLLIPLHAVLIGTGAPPLLAVSVLAAAGTTLSVLRPQFGTLRPRARKIWLVLHVGFSVGWLGAAMAMLVLALLGATTSDVQLRHHTYEIMHIFDLAIVIPLVLLSLLTGLIVSLGTKWGLVNYWWVLTKFLIALSIPVFAAIEESSWVRQAGALTERNPTADLAGTDTKLWACFVVFSLLLWTATALSTTKPWGKTRWGRRNTDRATHTRSPHPRPGRRPTSKIAPSPQRVGARTRTSLHPIGNSSRTAAYWSWCW